MTDRTRTHRHDRIAPEEEEPAGQVLRVAQRFSLTLAQAQALILVVGTDLAKLSEAVDRLGRKPG